MERRQFVKGSALLIGSVIVPSAMGAAPDNPMIFQQLVRDCYKLYFIDLDQAKYRALLTDDYLLLEDGEIMDVEKDISFMPTPEAEYRRKDAFDFKSVKTHGDIAYLVYFLKSEIKEKGKNLLRPEWLESMIVRRDADDVWRIALLHSTKLVKK